MTTEVPSGLSNSSIEANPRAFTSASIVLRVGSEVPETISATVPRPSPAASASFRIEVSPRAFIRAFVRAATSARASTRAEFRTESRAAERPSATVPSLAAYNAGIQLSGSPRGVSHRRGTVWSNTRSFGKGTP